MIGLTPELAELAALLDITLGQQSWLRTRPRYRRATR